MITPLAPLDPYTEVAAASFSTSMDSISFGFKLANGLKGVVEALRENPLSSPPPCPLKIIPSIIHRGSVPEKSELVPRTITRTGAPGTPAEDVTCTPVARPCICWSREEALKACRSLALMVETAPVKSRLTCVP